MIQELLKLIENVDPADTAKLDEIDARVDAYLGEKNFIEVIDKHRDGSVIWQSDEPAGPVNKLYSAMPVTRSRDALKAIRPEGWVVAGGTSRAGYIEFMTENTCDLKNYEAFRSRRCKTEELAELHAILQAIDYERGRG